MSNQKMAYSLKEAAKLTPYGYDRLRSFIDQGHLKAHRSSVGADGAPSGKYVIKHADLEDFLANLPEA